MFDFLNRQSIVKKMILIFITSALLPVIIQLLFFYVKIESDLQEDIDNRLNATLENKSKQVSGSISGVMTLARRYDQNFEISDGLSTIYRSDVDYFNQYNQIKKAIEGDVPYHQQVKRISLMSENPTLFNGGYVTRLVEGHYLYSGEEVFLASEIEDQNSTFIVTAVYNRKKDIKEKNVSYIKVMNHYNANVGYQQLIRIDLNMPYIADNLREVGLFKELMLVDDDYRVLASSTSLGQYDDYDVFDPDNLPGSSVYRTNLEGLPLSIYGIYDEDTIISRFYEYREFSFLVSITSILFAAFSIFIIANNIYRRMQNVVALSEHIAEGNFEQLQSPSGSDEFSEIESSMNIMSQRLESLIDSEYKSKILQVEMEKETVKAKLFALQSQVNPHFLFNALESIRLKSLAKKEKETALMIKHMAKMFRNLIDWEREIITLEEEIQFLKEFLSIQKYRFEDDFSYEIIVEDQLMTRRLPKMMIQPLVENACIHGSATGDPLNVTIHVETVAGGLKVRVIDNGGGITEEKLEEIRAHLAMESYSRNVGLYNVSQRLKLFCQEDYHFRINSTYGSGTTCELILPDS